MPDPKQDNLNLKNMQQYFDEANEFFKKNPKESIYSSLDEKVNVIKTNTTLNKSNTATELVAYRKDMLLGEGGFAAVYTGIREGGEVVAVKYSNFTQKSITDNLEISLLKRLKKQEISALEAQGQFRGHIQDVKVTKNGFELVDFTVMRLEKGQELRELLLSNLEKTQEFLSQTQKAQLSLKAVYAIYFMHSHQILHRDIKPENFMAWLKNDESSVPVIDTGFAATLAKDQDFMRDVVMGSKGYMANELEEYGIYSKKTDVFALGKTLGKIGFADPELIEKMTDNDPKNRPDTIDVIESLVDAVKKIPLNKLDVKTIELIDILEKIIIVEKNYTRETFKKQQVDNLITQAKKAGFKTDEIRDAPDPDTKAILLKALLLKDTHNKNPDKEKIISNIDIISRKAKFLGRDGCIEFSPLLSSSLGIPDHIKNNFYKPALKGYLLSQRRFPYLGKRQREIVSLLKNIKTDKSNTECITSYELEKFLNNKHFKELAKKNNNRPWESAKTENEKFLLIKGFLAVQANKQPNDKTLENLKKEFETIFKKSKIADYTEANAIKAFNAKTDNTPSKKRPLSDKEKSEIRQMLIEDKARVEKELAKIKKDPGQQAYTKRTITLNTDETTVVFKQEKIKTLKNRLNRIEQDLKSLENNPYEKLSKIQNSLKTLSQNQCDNTPPPYTDLTQVQEEWRKSRYKGLTDIRKGLEAGNTSPTSPGDKEIPRPEDRHPPKK